MATLSMVWACLALALMPPGTNRAFADGQGRIVEDTHKLTDPGGSVPQEGRHWPLSPIEIWTQDYVCTSYSGDLCFRFLPGWVRRSLVFWPVLRGFWISVTIRPPRKMVTEPVDSLTVTAMQSVTAVIAAAAWWRAPRPRGSSNSSWLAMWLNDDKRNQVEVES